MGSPVATGNPPARVTLSRAIAILLLILGSAGLVVAAATQLDEAWSGNFQAGSLLVGTDCQPSDQPVIGKLGAPTFAETGEQPWSIAHVEFANINEKCVGLNYEVAYRTGTDWVPLESANAKGSVEGSIVTVELRDLDVTPKEFAIVFL